MTIFTQIELNKEYEERVYAGVLGKIIGVYAGRPFEQWSNERIERELGEITGYVHQKFGRGIIEVDDDISGTFSFIRALAENGYDKNLSPAQIGDWWLNAIIENQSILWWGGIGLSTEHTAYLRLKQGYRAPESGSIALNGVAVAEEIGAQIFIDGWGMICPGNPALAADFARRAGSVSHDGEAIYGAQVVAALVAQAFVETDIRKMLTVAKSLIPDDCLIAQVIDDVQAWASDNGDDWRATLKRIIDVYPYSRFGTNCPMVSNHAIILLALLHGNSDFSRSLMIANTAGYDTDCNSGNVACILGVMLGLDALSAGYDWRGPVADRLFIPTADGGRAVTDAVRETYYLVNSARALADIPPTHPKNKAKFHFSLPGSVQGFLADETVGADGKLTVGNIEGCLALHLAGFAEGDIARAGTATFTPPYMQYGGVYAIEASPSLYPGQRVTAQVRATSDLTGTVVARIFVKIHAEDNQLTVLLGEEHRVDPNSTASLEYLIPDSSGAPIAEVGIQLSYDGQGATVDGAVFVDWLTWNGCPDMVLRHPGFDTASVTKAWVSSADVFSTGNFAGATQTFRVIKNSETGVVTQGTSDWTDYEVSTTVFTHLAARIGLTAYGTGLRRYVALVLDSDKRIRLIWQHDGNTKVLAESNSTWAAETRMALSLKIVDGIISARAGEVLLQAPATGLPTRGAVGFLVEAGHAEFGDVRVSPASN